jgi:hypothetical protein
MAVAAGSVKELFDAIEHVDADLFPTALQESSLCDGFHRIVRWVAIVEMYPASPPDLALQLPRKPGALTARCGERRSTCVQ